MNELQRKLARRRTLNGEADDAINNAGANVSNDGNGERDDVASTGPVPSPTVTTNKVQWKPKVSSEPKTGAVSESSKSKPTWTKPTGAAAASNPVVANTQPDAAAPVVLNEVMSAVEDGSSTVDKLTEAVVIASTGSEDVSTLEKEKFFVENPTVPVVLAPAVSDESLPSDEASTLESETLGAEADSLILAPPAEEDSETTEAVISACDVPSSPVLRAVQDSTSSVPGNSVRLDRDVGVTAEPVEEPDNSSVVLPRKLKAIDKLERLLEVDCAGNLDEQARSRPSITDGDKDIFKEVNVVPAPVPSIASTSYSKPTVAVAPAPASTTCAEVVALSTSYADEETEDNIDDYDDDYSYITDNKRTSKTGAALFDDILDAETSATVGGRRPLASISNNHRAAETLRANSSSDRLNAHTAVSEPGGEEDELEMLKKLVQDDDDISVLSKKHSITHSRVAKVSESRLGDGDEEDSGQSYNAISIEEAINSQSTPHQTKRRSSFNSQRTNLKSWMSTLRVDPTMSANNLFVVDEDGSSAFAEVLDGGLNVGASHSLAEQELMQSLFEEGDHAPASGGDDHVSNSDAMDQLFQNSGSTYGGNNLQGRSNLVSSSFVAMEPMTNPDDVEPTDNSRLLSKLENHGLFADECQLAGSTTTTVEAPPRAKTLFRDIPQPAKKEKPVMEDLSYDDFMKRLTHRRCNDLKQVIRWAAGC
jgi:hypothetical protein